MSELVPEQPKKIGRPSKYTPRLAYDICQRIANGETLIQVCRDDDMPGRSTVLRWAQHRRSFRDKLTRARESAAWAWAEESIEIADDGSNDWMDRETKSGRVVRKLDHEHVQRSKLRIETRRHLMGCLAPQIFGNRVDVRHGGEVTHALDFGSILPEAVQGQASVSAPQTPAASLPEPTPRDGGVSPTPESDAKTADESAGEGEEAAPEVEWTSTLPAEYVLEQPAKPEDVSDDDEGTA